MAEPTRLPMRVLLFRLGVICGALILALLIASGLYATRGELEAVSGEQARTTVMVFEPMAVPVRREFIGYGPAQAMRSADVPARVGATVVWVNPDIDEGVAVAAGVELVRLDPDDFERRLRAAREALQEVRTQLKQLDAEATRLEEQLEIDEKDTELTRNEYERVQKLLERGSANQQDLDAAERQWLTARRQRAVTREQLDALPSRREGLEARIAAAEAELELAELNLARTKISAPIAGVVQAFDVEPGENVASGERIARVVNLNRIEVPLQLPSSARGHIGTGDPVTLSAASNATATWDATIARVAPEDDAATRTYTVYVEVEQPGASQRFGDDRGDQLLTPGLFLTGLARADDQQQRWVVPRRSLREGRVLLVEDGVVRSVDVEEAFSVQRVYPQLGLPDNQFAVLRGDLPEGSAVVINASASVTEGETVNAVVIDDPAPRPDPGRDHTTVDAQGAASGEGQP